MTREENLGQLKTETFDICIIGAGASGAGCALDAALRGFKVALIEKKDFSSGTSSRSTKLVHGGVRYLEQAFKKFDFAQLRQVRHGLEERHYVIRNAPHLARPLALLTPVATWLSGLYFTIGLKLYSWIAGRRDTLPSSEWLSKKQALKRMPGLNGKILHSAVLYYDGQLNDARYCLALVHSADEAGAAVLNYAEVTGFDKDDSGQLESARILDGLSGEEYRIKAKLFINCTGPYSDHIRLMANPEQESRIRPSKGVHLMLPYDTLGSEAAMLIPETKDGRVVFAIPFEDKVLLGTTDTDYRQLDEEPILEKQEVDYLLETLNRYLDQPVKTSDVKAGFGGLRPLVAASSREDTKSLLRDHMVEHDQASGLLSLLGGKWTTYRLMAKDTIDKACRILDIDADCRTSDHYLVGGEGYDFAEWRQLARQYGFGEDTARHLLHNYGSRARQVAAYCDADPTLSVRLHENYPYIKAEVVYQVEEEMARTPRDILARRIRLEILDWRVAHQITPEVSALIGSKMGWSEEEVRSYARAYQEELEKWMKAAELPELVSGS
ncbi:glycerol-3-phosphate dehydrogenase/oxidase [Flavilitoribacter nigricans]|uniref:FAD-dependent oxidoreductase n=1 Tax=Flavilitoribacter nigricans (strain ATCC 23147 / DSM 23189 / NBRC 102662 / NCIMB 1420 / SS-2) TaxID=1122177 RepID=A0A2D0N5K8_FLAN2|nr:FAD-dependent oxidoreductase [Flavilitoribacter nigricans]PHN03666.1 FAD-dependent oxidoreductase [Flavilitoribacter nigricans DSM 23189 = NBRC 102662]